MDVSTVIVTILVLVNLVAAGSQFFSAEGKPLDYRRKGFFNKINKRGWTFIFLTLVSIGLSITLFLVQKLESEDAISEQDRKAKKSEALIIKRADESEANIVNTFTSSLAKYGYKYDSSLKIIKRLIKDSTNRNNPAPIMSACGPFKIIEWTKNEISFSVTFCVSANTAYSVKSHFRIAYQDSISNKPIVVLGEETYGSFNKTYPAGGRVEEKMIIETDYADTRKVYLIYVFATITYKSEDGKKAMPITELLRLNLKDTLMDFPPNRIADEVMPLFN